MIFLLNVLISNSRPMRSHPNITLVLQLCEMLKLSKIGLSTLLANNPTEWALVLSICNGHPALEV